MFVMRRLPMIAASVIAAAVGITACVGGGGGYRVKEWGINGEGAIRRLTKITEKIPGRVHMSYDYREDPDRLDWSKPGGEILVSPVAQTKAMVIRKSGNFEIDVTKDTEIQKLKSGDTLQLQPGRYNPINLSRVDGVTIRGVPGQTSIGELDKYNPRAWKNFWPLQTGANTFWDIYFPKVSLVSSAERVWMFGCRFEHPLNGSKPSAKDQNGVFVVAFSHLGYQVWPSYQEDNVDGAGYMIFDSLLHRQSFKSESGEGQTEILTSSTFLRGPKAKALVRAISEDHLKDYVAKKSPVTPRLANAIQSARTAILQEAIEADKGQFIKFGGMQKAFYAEAMRYLMARTEYKPEFDKPKVENIMARADKELKSTNYLVAYAMMKHATQKYGAYEHPPARAIIDRAEKSAGDRYACSMSGDRMSMLREWALKNIPILNTSVPNSSCKINVYSTAPADTAGESVTAVTNEVRFEEYDPMIRYKEMMRAAAAKEQEKAFAAGMDASVERMKDTARKMYDGRVRQEGNYLVYGSGNFGGNASAGTLSAQRTAQQNAQSYQQAANAASQKGMAVKEVNVQHQTFYVNYTKSVGMSATIEKKGEPSRRLNGAVQTAAWSRGPCQRNDANNFERDKMTGNCLQNGPVIGTPYGGNMSSAYEKTVVQPFFVSFVAESIVPNAVKKIVQSKQSKDPGTRLESLLLTHYTNLGQVDAAEVARLAQEVTGESLSLDDFTEHLGIN